MDPTSKNVNIDIYYINISDKCYIEFLATEKNRLNTRKKYDIFTCENIICCKRHCHGRFIVFH